MMIDLFIEYARNSLIKFVEQNYDGFDLVKMNKGDARQYVRYVKKFNNMSVFLQYRLIHQSCCIEPTVQWSTLHRFPDNWEFLFGKDEYNLENFDHFEEVCLTARPFTGRAYACFDMAHKKPSMQRLKEIFGSEHAKETLLSFDIEDWRDMDIYHSWDIINELFPGILTTEDAKYAFGDSLDEIKDITHNHYIPYLESVVRRKSVA